MIMRTGKEKVDLLKNLSPENNYDDQGRLQLIRERENIDDDSKEPSKD
jgi:hypothetical protein